MKAFSYPLVNISTNCTLFFKTIPKFPNISNKVGKSFDHLILT